jgi:hypothetical protein
MIRYSKNTQSVIRISKIRLKNNKATWMHKSMCPIFFLYCMELKGDFDSTLAELP